ncbi:MAG: phage tail family protein [Oscillospiraceae bacterium]|nr:phage tail family protein [Oscillospiraceae bacterium]
MVTVSFDSLNSYTDLGLFLAEATIEEPAPKRTVADVPCRDGALDLSYALTSTMKYKNRVITLTFRVIDYTNDWVNVFGNIARQLHGKKMKVVFSSDPNWYWDSFITVEHTSEFNVGTIEVICNAYPYKRKDVSLSTTATSSGSTVTATVTQQTIVPTVTSANAITITTGGNTYSFAAGTHLDPALQLAAGTHSLVVKGSGAVTIAYKDGSF